MAKIDTEKKLPSEWEEVFDLRVVDRDGWDSEEDWAKPITREDFQVRLSYSTSTFRSR